MNRVLHTSLLIDPETERFLAVRHRRARVWRALFLISIVIGILALATLLASILNQSMGLVAYEGRVDPAALSTEPLTSLESEELAAVIRANLRPNRVRTLEREGPLADRPREDLLAIVFAEIVRREPVATYDLLPSIFERERILTEIKALSPDATVEFRSWLNGNFLRSTMSSRVELSGIRTALLGSLMLIAITILVAFPIGVGAAIYLQEYTSGENRLNRIIQTNIDNLAGVPSIVYGILGLAIFVRALAPLTGGELLGVSGQNGRTILSAGLTMALLVLPIIIINAQEAIRAVPNSLRLASYGLGATQWQTIWHHVLPYALPGILTGTILAISRAIGETAPLIVIGASTYLTSDPTGLFSNFTALPIQIYDWTKRPQAEFRNIAAAAILVLLAMLLSLNAVAILLRNRFSRR